jgi:hypothetical protein
MNRGVKRGIRERIETLTNPCKILILKVFVESKRICLTCWRRAREFNPPYSYAPDSTADIAVKPSFPGGSPLRGLSRFKPTTAFVIPVFAQKV